MVRTPKDGRSTRPPYKAGPRPIDLDTYEMMRCERDLKRRAGDQIYNSRHDARDIVKKVWDTLGARV